MAIKIIFIIIARVKAPSLNIVYIDVQYIDVQNAL